MKINPVREVSRGGSVCIGVVSKPNLRRDRSAQGNSFVESAVGAVDVNVGNISGSSLDFDYHAERITASHGPGQPSCYVHWIDSLSHV
jgi:hypothetical protein